MPETAETKLSSHVETFLADRHCYLIRNCLSLSEQTLIFQDILNRSKTTDNAPNRTCMNPTPKTIIFDGNHSTLKFNDGNNVYAQFIVQRANATLREELRNANDTNVTNDKNNTNDSLPNMIAPSSSSSSERQSPSMSVGVIRYPVPHGSFPEHVDHCNDNSWVYLLSLGCSANFVIRGPRGLRGPREGKKNTNGTNGGTNETNERTFRFESGDILVFDPSTDAGIVHGVRSINEDDCPDGGPVDFRRYRFGVQCRVKRCQIV